MTKKNTFQTPIGTRDVEPADAARWQALISAFQNEAELAGYGLLHTPIFEDLGVVRRLGEGTDVVTKEMYDFVDKGGRTMALRPEGTAAVCRSFVQHRPPTPWKVWYHGPFFRYESPQAGRQRQFSQLGIEAIGSADPDIDVEIIAVAAKVLEAVGLKRVLLLINTMGDADTRVAYTAAVRDHLKANITELDASDRVRVDDHPLRVLDSKHMSSRDVTTRGPQLRDFLSTAAISHFERVQAGLGALGIAFAIEPRLVRGLDYYTHTLFEFQASALDGAQNTLCGGGRYDGLVEELGGPDTPGIGFAMGIERLLLACDAERTYPAPDIRPQVWVIDVTDGTSARDLTHQLRASGHRADRSFDGRSMRSQMKAADRSGAVVALIVGDSELADGTVAVRRLRESADQAIIARTDVVAHVAQVLAESPAISTPKDEDIQ